MQDVYWYSDKNLLPRDQDRTAKLIDGLEFTYAIQFNTIEHPYQDLIKKFTDTKNYGGITTLISYIKRHPDMLKYKFDENEKMSKIIVDPNRYLTFKWNSKERQCDMSYGITELLKLHIEYLKLPLPIGVEMDNETYCKSQGFESKLQPQPQEQPTTSGNTYESDIPVTAGGSKSRRKQRARKTRRGRGRSRGRSRKSKTKTHRRRRHSRARKHKKNTYTRRR